MTSTLKSTGLDAYTLNTADESMATIVVFADHGDPPAEPTPN
jgi:hypothetical protein